MNTKYRTHTCGELRDSDKGKKVKLAGWVVKRRDHGGVIFIDLRDRFGITQIVFEPDCKDFKQAERLGREFCIHVSGLVDLRKPGMENPKLETGKVEIFVDHLEILNTSETPPFELDDRVETAEEIRLKYRYLDLRRERLSNNLVFRAQVIKFLRDWMHAHGFVEVETPLLSASSPEGARDFLVPSRIHPGKFYALPQAPQQYKQLLMVGGMDKYFQIAACMRDEDARADRSPGEFYQLDVETSFLTQEEFFQLMEPLMIEVSKKFCDKKIMQVPFPRIKFNDALLKYGSDKPDIRFGMEIQEVSHLVKDSGFEVFKNTIKDGGVVRALVAPGAANKFTRSDLDDVTKLVQDLGAKGLGYISLKDKEVKSPLKKFLGDELVHKIIKEVNAKDGDIIFFMADKELKAAKILGQLRLDLGKRLGVIDQSILAWTWIVDFPMFEWNDDTNSIDFAHNPFSMPQGGLEALESQDPLKILAYQYDIVCNGTELSSGAVRNNVPDIMYKAFDIAGYKRETVEKKFGHMISAFKFGAPPHCGFAPGIERLVMILRGEPNIREVTAFPKSKSAEDVMMGAPSEVDPKQLRELHIKVDVVKKK